MTTWPWKGFRRSEMACKCGCGFDTFDAELLVVLSDLRAYFNTSVVINSGCRCREYNERIQQQVNLHYKPYTSKSQHMQGRAADVVCRGVSPQKVYNYLNLKYKGRFGIGKYLTFVHIDTRSNYPWRQG